jgi:hypothetical protein
MCHVLVIPLHMRDATTRGVTCCMTGMLAAGYRHKTLNQESAKAGFPQK